MQKNRISHSRRGQFAIDSTFRRHLVCAMLFVQGAGALDTQSVHLRIPVNVVQVTH